MDGHCTFRNGRTTIEVLGRRGWRVVRRGVPPAAPRGMDAVSQDDGTWLVTDIVERIASGDRSAETALVRRFSHVVLYVLRRRVRDDEAARDLHQETFITVLRRLRAGELESAAALPAFVRQTAMNLASGV